MNHINDKKNNREKINTIENKSYKEMKAANMNKILYDGEKIIKWSYLVSFITIFIYRKIFKPINNNCDQNKKVYAFLFI